MPVPSRTAGSWCARTGQYGAEFLRPDAVTAIGLGANRPQDAVYPDLGEGRRRASASAARTGTSFISDKGAEPPVKGFWSLTMYDDRYFFVPNALNRFTLGQRNKFTTNPDGSVDLYCPERQPRWRQGGQLASGAAQQVHPGKCASHWPERRPPPPSSTAPGSPRPSSASTGLRGLREERRAAKTPRCQKRSVRERDNLQSLSLSLSLKKLSLASWRLPV